jgi:hypothetical protein
MVYPYPPETRATVGDGVSRAAPGRCPGRSALTYARLVRAPQRARPSLQRVERPAYAGMKRAWPVGKHAYPLVQGWPCDGAPPGWCVSRGGRWPSPLRDQNHRSHHRHFCKTFSPSPTIVSSLSTKASRVARTRCPGHAHTAKSSGMRKHLGGASTTCRAGASSAVHHR